MRKKNTAISFAVIIVISVIIGITVNGVWNLIEKKTHPIEYKEYVSKYSVEFGVPEKIIYATIKTESGFDTEAVSSADCVGLMQLSPTTFEWLTSDEHLDEALSFVALTDPEVNIRYGTYYLSYLAKKFDYNWDTVYAAYNGGEGRVASWLADSRYSDGNGGLEKIPIGETRAYVKKINKAIKIYTRLYPELT